MPSQCVCISLEPEYCSIILLSSNYHVLKAFVEKLYVILKLKMFRRMFRRRLLSNWIVIVQSCIVAPSQLTSNKRKLQKWIIFGILLTAGEVEFTMGSLLLWASGLKFSKKILHKNDRHDLHRCSKMTHKKFPEFKVREKIRIFFFKIDPWKYYFWISRWISRQFYLKHFFVAPIFRKNISWFQLFVYFFQNSYCFQNKWVIFGIL